MVAETRQLSGWSAKRIVFNEDDLFDLHRPMNNSTTATRARASWEFFDCRMKDEGFDDGGQSMPVNWNISSERKRNFFRLLREITASGETPPPATPAR